MRKLMRGGSRKCKCSRNRRFLRYRGSCNRCSRKCKCSRNRHFFRYRGGGDRCSRKRSGFIHGQCCFFSNGISRNQCGRECGSCGWRGSCSNRGFGNRSDRNRDKRTYFVNRSIPNRGFGNRVNRRRGSLQGNYSFTDPKLVKCDSLTNTKLDRYSGNRS